MVAHGHALYLALRGLLFVWKWCVCKGLKVLRALAFKQWGSDQLFLCFIHDATLTTFRVAALVLDVTSLSGLPHPHPTALTALTIQPRPRRVRAGALAGPRG